MVGPGSDMQEWPLKWGRLSAQYSGIAMNGTLCPGHDIQEWICMVDPGSDIQE
jgi:hypothetical protein